MVRKSGAIRLCVWALSGALSLMAVSDSLIAASEPSAGSRRPNIVYILADDLGYGDVQHLNPDLGKVPTPQIDKIAAEGMTFTDAHTSSSVCTPTRYSILTGRYNWRTHLQEFVLDGFDAPLIPADRLTVAGLLRDAGYATACIGKWHLGLGIPVAEERTLDVADASSVDWKGRISGGPTDLGFDYFYGIAGSLNMPPYIYIENDRFVGAATAIKAFNREGLSEPDFEAVDTLPEISRRTVEFIERQSSSKPFFVYVALTSPHTPILPTTEWRGRSEIGAYGDFVMQTDAVIGEIVAAVDAAGFRDNTLVVVTSDNGCSKWANIEEMLERGHHPSGPFRGSKSDLWDGGHRVPFVVRWPARVEPGTSSDELISLNDLMATCAELVGTKLPDDAGEDSVSFLPALEGGAITSTRAGVVHHSFSGHFAYRQGEWKLLLAKASGGWSSPMEAEASAHSPPGQLYDMENDPGETNNLYRSRSEVVERLLSQLESDVRRGRSTKGSDQPNDHQGIVLWKSGE